MLIAIESLSDLSKVEGGVVDRLFAEGLRAAIHDCRERPVVDKPREISLKVKLTPVAEEGSGVLAEIKGEFELKNNVPVSRTRKLSMAAKGDSLVYNDLSREDVRQGTLPIEPK